MTTEELPEIMTWISPPFCMRRKAFYLLSRGASAGLGALCIVLLSRVHQYYILLDGRP